MRGLRRGRQDAPSRGWGGSSGGQRRQHSHPFPNLCSPCAGLEHTLLRGSRDQGLQVPEIPVSTEGSWSLGHVGPSSQGLAGSLWTCRAPPPSSHHGAWLPSGLRPSGPQRPKLWLSELPLLPRPPGQRVRLCNPIPAEKATAAAEWAPPRNPSLIAHGPCHPHQLPHRRWEQGPATGPGTAGGG